MKYFYAEIIKMDSVITQLDELDLTEGQKITLSELVDSTIHQTILDVAFSGLSLQDKRAFAEKVKNDPTDKTLLDFLRERTDNIEEEIIAAVEELKKDLEKDIKEAKRMI